MATSKPNREFPIIEGLLARGMITRKSDTVDMTISGGGKDVLNIQNQDDLDDLKMFLFDLCELMGFKFIDAMNADCEAGNVGPATIARYTKQVQDALRARQIPEARSARRTRRPRSAK